MPPVSPSLWKQFVDDVISAVSENEIVVLLQQFNSIEPSIQFTVEHHTDRVLPFWILIGNYILQYVVVCSYRFFILIKLIGRYVIRICFSCWGIVERVLIYRCCCFM